MFHLILNPVNPPLIAQVRLPIAVEEQKPIPNNNPVLPDPPVIQQTIVTEYQSVLPLPGSLNKVPVFNSNSPEVVAKEGVLLSTFPALGKSDPNAHLNFPLSGRFDIFTHHIWRPVGERRPLYQGILLTNPTGKIRTVNIIRGLSYLNSKDAPFKELPPFVDDPDGTVYSGPGSRLVGDLLRGKNEGFPSVIKIAPYSTVMLANLPIPVSSSRSTYVQVETDGGVYVANLAKYEVQEEIITRKNTDKPPEEPTKKPTMVVRPPNLEEWKNLLIKGSLVEPRDIAPIVNQQGRSNIYGRVAGVSEGSQWITNVTNSPTEKILTIPEVGQSFSFPISTTNTGTFATDQNQSAKMLARYPDTALEGHGNYLVYYQLTFPLKNPTKETQQVTLTFQTPIKQNLHSDRLTFFAPPPPQIFFRGTVRGKYLDEANQPVERYVHLVQRRGEKSEPLLTMTIPPGETRSAHIDLFYPPDATPPQVITIHTLPNRSIK